MGARFGASRSFRHDLHDRWGGRFDPHENRMYAIHSAEVTVWICVEDPQAGRAPCSAQVNPEAIVVLERVADPVGTGTVLHDDDDAAAVVEIPHGDAAALTRSTAHRFDDERVFSGVWRPWDTYEKGELGDLVRETHDLLRNSHLIAPSHLTIVCLAVL